MNICRAVVTASVVFASMHAAGYEKPTHREMSQRAIVKSKIAGTELRLRWGLSSFSYPYTKGDDQFIGELIALGAEDEDDPAPRVLAHFYDPKYNQPLSICGFFPIGASSPEWAINGAGQLDNQRFSYADARIAMRDGLTKQSPSERSAKLGLMFETLGHVIHHLQDMDQPQHRCRVPHW